MRLLICAQAVDQDDPALGFFHEWIAALAKRFDTVEVICLQEGRLALPTHVHVHSLGKETGRKSRVQYALRFLSFVWSLRSSYDVVFVHQNQEYVLLAGLPWKLLGKRTYLWRNHYAGSLLTRIAVALTTKVFCTSSHSYTARFSKTVLMPVGVDTSLFRPNAAIRVPGSILFLGRMAPSKRPDVFIEALGVLAQQGMHFTATLCGPTLPKDATYLVSLTQRVSELGLGDRVTFKQGVPHAETPTLYALHDIFVNLAESGMYDKTLFEAAASGCIVVALSDDFAKLAGERLRPRDESARAIADVLNKTLTLSTKERQEVTETFLDIAQKNNLQLLIARLGDELTVAKSGTIHSP